MEFEGFIFKTERDRALFEISILKSELTNSDYKAIKYAEGLLTAEEYEPTKKQRAEWRARINELEAQLGE